MKIEKSFSWRELTNEDLARLTDEQKDQLAKEIFAQTVDEDLPILSVEGLDKLIDYIKILSKTAGRQHVPLVEKRDRLKRAHRQTTIRRPPGSRLNDLAAFIYFEDTYREVFKPVIMDRRRDYFDALNRGEIWKARWANVCGICHFWITVAWHALSAIATLMKKVWTIAG